MKDHISSRWKRDRHDVLFILASNGFPGYAGGMKRSQLGWFMVTVSFFLPACLASTQPAASIPSPLVVANTQTRTPLPPPPTITPSPFVSLTYIVEPLGCQKPPDDYRRIEINGWTLNGRTLAMLEQAQNLYGGEQEITGYAITQGSYTDGESASFGTHAGGGAVDLSVLRKGTYEVLWDDIDPLLQALRTAGFAAWLREYGELYDGSPIHIHAIAIGDAELSPAALDQLTGEAGYFRGFSGLPVKEGELPTLDRYGGPVICQWMIELGYRDLR